MQWFVYFSLVINSCTVGDKTTNKTTLKIISTGFCLHLHTTAHCCGITWAICFTTLWKIYMQKESEWAGMAFSTISTESPVAVKKKTQLCPKVVHVDVNRLVSDGSEPKTSHWGILVVHITHTHTSGLGGGFLALCEMKSLNLSIKFCFRRQIKISAEQRATNVEGHKRKWVMITRSFLLPYSANTHTGNTHRRVHIHTDQPTDKQVAITSVAREYWTSVTGPM